MEAKYDIAVLGPYGAPSLVVEVKARANTDATWAERTRFLLLHRTGFPPSASFLLVTRDMLYLWSAGTEDREVPPAVTSPVAPILRRYLDRAGLDLERIHPSTLVSLVEQWLDDLTADAYPVPPESWLVTSGLTAAIRGGRVASQAAA